MGSRGPVKKPDEKKRGQSKPETVVELVVDNTKTKERKVPAMPTAPKGTRWLKATRDAWERYWRDPVSDLVRDDDDQSGLDRVIRWIQYRDEWQRAMNKGRRQTMVPGSTGQPTLNPLLAKYVPQLEKAIAAAELELGMTPYAKARMNLTRTDAAMNLVDLMRSLSDEDDDGGAGSFDPGPDVIDVEALE